MKEIIGIFLSESDEHSSVPRGKERIKY